MGGRGKIMYKKMWFKQKKGEWQAFTRIYSNVKNQNQLQHLKKHVSWKTKADFSGNGWLRDLLLIIHLFALTSVIKWSQPYFESLH